MIDVYFHQTQPARANRYYWIQKRPSSTNQLGSFLIVCIRLLWIPWQNIYNFFKRLSNLTMGRHKNNCRKPLIYIQHNRNVHIENKPVIFCKSFQWHELSEHITLFPFILCQGLPPKFSKHRFVQQSMAWCGSDDHSGSWGTRMGRSMAPSCQRQTWPWHVSKDLHRCTYAVTTLGFIISGKMHICIGTACKRIILNPSWGMKLIFIFQRRRCSNRRLRVTLR